MITTSSLQPSLLASELLATGTMSLPLHSPTLSERVKQTLDAALSEYKDRTKIDLSDNWLAREVQGCESAEAVLDIIQREAKAFDKFRGGNKRLMKWIGPSVDVLYTISATLGQGVGMVRIIKTIRDYKCTQLRVQVVPSANMVSAGIGVLLVVRSSVFLFIYPLSFNADILQAAKDVKASHYVLVDLFERVQFFLKRLRVHTRIMPSKDMVDILVKIMVEVLSILAIATKEVQQSRTSKSNL
jgi:hypothetical protein